MVITSSNTINGYIYKCPVVMSSKVVFLKLSVSLIYSTILMILEYCKMYSEVNDNTKRGLL